MHMLIEVQGQLVGSWFSCVSSAEGVLTELRHLARPNRYELRSVSQSCADPQYSWLVAGQEVGISLILVLTTVALKHPIRVRQQKLQSSDSAASQEGDNLRKQRVTVVSKKGNGHGRVQTGRKDLG